MSSRRESLRVGFVLAAFGVLSLFSMLSRPTLATIRAVDFVHLIGTGMCLGGAIVALVWARSRQIALVPNYVFKPTAMRHFVLTNCRRVAAA